RYAGFEPGMNSAALDAAALEVDLRAALARDEFRVVYQPIYNLEDLSLLGVEALLRWEHPMRGLLLPDEFIPVLERTGQIVEVGRWVLGVACRQMAAWRER